MIQLNSLYIKSNFKNLNNLFVDFEKSKGITLLIGNNGSGKSNIIEALSSVFAGLFDNSFDPNFNYELKYNKDDVPITISYDSTKTKNKYSITLPNASFDYLPTKVISVYSGEESRLWNRYYFQFYESFMKDVISNKKRFSDNQRMEFINKYYWNLALLTMVVSDLDISDIIGQKKIKSIVLEYKKNNLDNITTYTTNEVIRFAKLLHSLGRGEPTNKDKRTIDIDELKNKVSDTHTEFFKLFAIALLPKESNWKLINKLEIILDNGVNTEELSEGEKKQILIKFITRIFADDNSILLLDEPDSHIHIHNKEKLKKLLLDSSSNNKPYVQSILTTHSPTLTHCFENENVYMLVLKDGKVEIQDNTKQEIVYQLTNEFWSLQEQNIFHSSTKPIVLFVEGVHDKRHISNAYKLLESEYKDLHFDIFSLGGEDKIHGFMNGLYEANLTENKVYIAIYDSDKAGDQAYTKAGYLPLQPPTDFRKLKEDKIKHNNFFALKLPKPDNHTADCTIENMFDATLYECAYKEALEGRIGKFLGESIKDVNEEIVKDSKNILSNKTENITDKEGFKHFRKLFDLINEIRKYHIIQKVKPEITKIATALQQIVVIPEKVSAKENHLAYWTAFKTFVSKQDVSFKLQSPAAQHWTYVSIGSSAFKISILANTQNKTLCVQLLCLGKNALNNFRILKLLLENDAKKKLSPQVEWKENNGKKEHHINLVFPNNDPFKKEDWNNQHQLLLDWTEKFYNYFKDRVKKFN